MASIRRTRTRLLTISSLLTIKGAPEILLERVTSYVGPSGTALPLDEVTLQSIEATKDEWASQGRRVLLLARKAISGSTFPPGMSSTVLENEMFKQAKSGLTLVGLVGIVDPPRPEIPGVIDTLRTAGIRIFMVRRCGLELGQLLTDLGYWRLCTYSPSDRTRVWHRDLQPCRHSRRPPQSDHN